MLLACGVLLAALVVRSRIRRPTAGEQQATRITNRLATATTPWFAVFGALGMVVNFSTLLLVLPAVHEITHSTASTTDQAVAFTVTYLIVLLPVLAPVLLATVLGRGADLVLDAAHEWVGRNARTMGTVIEAVFAAYLIVRGVRAIP